MKKWTQTDNGQWYRKLPLEHNGYPVFEFYRLQEGPIDKRSVVLCHSVVDTCPIFVFSTDIKEILDQHDYARLEDVKKEFGDDWQRIVAEWRFKNICESYKNVVFGGQLMTLEEGTRLVEVMINDVTEMSALILERGCRRNCPGSE